MSKKEQILQLRQDGKNYAEIMEVVGCSKSLICYYCGFNQKAKSAGRQQKKRKENVLLRKVDSFKYKERLTTRTRNFQARVVGNKYGERENTFSHKDVLARFGEKTVCYLTGQPIDLTQPRTYSFDHIIPKAKGGDNSFENLGIVCREANQAKHDLLVDELLVLCERILKHHGYQVTR